jgi:predicted helicase
MRRAVAFCQSIKASEKIAAAWNTAADAYLGTTPPCFSALESNNFSFKKEG